VLVAALTAWTVTTSVGPMPKYLGLAYSVSARRADPGNRVVAAQRAQGILRQLSNRVGRKPVAAISYLPVALLIYPAFLLLNAAPGLPALISVVPR
jgi:hypothetical protein